MKVHGSIGYGPPQVACYVLSGAWHGDSMERKHRLLFDGSRWDGKSPFVGVHDGQLASQLGYNDAFGMDEMGRGSRAQIR